MCVCVCARVRSRARVRARVREQTGGRSLARARRVCGCGRSRSRGDARVGWHISVRLDVGVRDALFRLPPRLGSVGGAKHEAVVLEEGRPERSRPQQPPLALLHVKDVHRLGAHAQHGQQVPLVEQARARIVVQHEEVAVEARAVEQAPVGEAHQVQRAGVEHGHRARHRRGRVRRRGRRRRARRLEPSPIAGCRGSRRVIGLVRQARR
mmetsp:Transcript_793/g.3087  ORF Transcript_793/g.3087 Transcript_793/m.3087 type:complete len:209 (+) Transcript_793:1491-2117(+)